MLLAGDIGGTKTLLALGEKPGGTLVTRFERRYENADFDRPEDLFARFIDDVRAAGFAADSIRAACIAVAGPARDGRVALTNIDWSVDAERLGAAIAVPGVELVNDFAAVAAGIEVLGPDDVVTLQAGEPSPQGPRVAIGAGTGLGVAYLVWQDGRYRAIPSEGGHTGFAPASEEQARLWGFLQGRLGRVEWEDVVSGGGLEAIHAFFSGKDWTPGAAPTTAAEVASRALDHGDAIASHALDVFASCYGAVAGDHALALLARGGVYIAGGIAPKILPRLVEGPFLAAFNAKRRYESLARSIPVRVVTNERVGLLGALLLAVRAASQD